MRSWSLLLLAACASAPPVPDYPPLEEVPSLVTSEPAPRRVTISVVGTNDVHGHFERLARFGGMLTNLRRVREADGAVVLLDGGDMWQGTLASNLDEGSAMVRAFGALGYDAVTIGNHEFDYGPAGAPATPRSEADDPRGALLARVGEARFPVLGAAFLDAASGTPVRWEGVRRAVMLEKAGLKIGVIGVSTEETLTTTIAANVRDLRMAPLAETITTLAAELRAEGAALVFVAAHAGGHCRAFDDPDDLSSCNPDEEVFELARALAPGTVEVIVAGHTHRGVAHRVNGIAILESFALGRAFGRADLVLEDGRLVETRIHPPTFFCPAEEEAPECPPGEYEGASVEPDQVVAQIASAAMEAAAEREAEPLNVRFTSEMWRNYVNESPLGNFLADLLLEARPRADVAVLNAGGIRASMDEGPLTYGELYETFPFDNRFATVRLTVAQAKEILRFHLQRDDGALNLAGVRVEARCRGEELDVTIRDRRGRVMRDDRMLTVATSDYLATTPVFEGLPEGSVVLEESEPIREAFAAALRRRGGDVDPARYYDRERPRVVLPSARSVRCAPEAASAE
ncbi:MAG: 5'-nucleotidase C-terminal domain-containing protein [Sandaracinus sp.]|nr:5'-nucleotidase C-terminal domain-containing protein [Sandaracinus sp.]MCB9630960.1 5'-nucleotidase C-terminal domain-containing protein [Sandaracinus sp.]